MGAGTHTIQLPDDLYRRLERFAKLTKQSIEGLIVRALASSLPSVPERLSPDIQSSLQALESRTDEDLFALLNALLPPEQYQRLTELRELRSERPLAPEEEDELARLLAAADLLTLEKGYAGTLLRWRGHRLPLTVDLPLSQS